MPQITIRNKSSHLHLHYHQETDSQPVYIELHLEQGWMQVRVDTLDRVASQEVDAGIVRRYLIPELTEDAVTALMEELLPLAQRVVDGSRVVWDNDYGDNVGRLDADADLAEEQIRDLIPLEDEVEGSDVVTVWDVDSATNGEERGEYGITASTSELRLAEIEQAILSDLAGVSESDEVICDGLLEHLMDLREEAADESPATPAEVTLTREYLGMTGDDLAARLGVNPRTVRSWEHGRDSVSGRVTVMLAQLRHEADAQVAAQVAQHAGQDAPELVTYRAKSPDAAVLPRRVQRHGTGWHRMVTARAAGQLPGARVSFAGEE